MNSLDNDIRTPVSYRVGLYLKMGGLDNPNINFTRYDLDIYKMYNPHNISNGYVKKLELLCVHKIQPELCIKWKYLREVTLSGTITDLPKKCFAECMNLTHVELPTNLTIIHNKCFRKCTNLKSIVLPNNINLLSKCFDGCRELTSVKCNGTIANIGNGCFNNCSNLKIFDVQQINRCYSNAFTNTLIQMDILKSVNNDMVIVEVKEKVKKEKRFKKKRNGKK